MANYKQTKNYNWLESNMVGRGATSYVYKGRCRGTGKACAIKVFLGNSDNCKETEILLKIKHENVVTLYAVEEELMTYNPVIVMEYCSEGTLLDILRRPEYGFGLGDDELLTLLDGISNGMSYLRTMNLIHRDIKPGNILLHVTDAGQHVYKLTDFGTARELADDGKFMTLVGTEEFLHPEMFCRLVRTQDATPSHRANVDLWSIGVTLYHAATGNLPFRPFCYRRTDEDRRLLYNIITQKKPGHISGIQHSRGGPIEYTEKLPDVCNLSPHLRELLPSMLAGLCECDEQKCWSFDDFFRKSRELLSKQRVKVFQPSTGEIRDFYLSDLQYGGVAQAVCNLWGIELNNLALFRGSRLLRETDTEPVVQLTAPRLGGGTGSGAPETPAGGGTCANMKNGAAALQLLTAAMLRPVATQGQLACLEGGANLSPPNKGQTFTIQQDVDYINEALRIFYEMRRKIIVLEAQTAAFYEFADTYQMYIQELMVSAKSMSGPLVQSIRQTCALFTQAIELAEVGGRIPGDRLAKIRAEIKTALDKAEEGEKCARDYTERIVEKSMLRKQWEDESRSTPNEDLVNTVDCLIAEADRIKQTVEKEKQIDAKHHQLIAVRAAERAFDRQRLFELSQQGNQRLQARRKELDRMHKVCAKWLVSASSVIARVTKLQEFFDKQEKRRVSMELALSDLMKELIAQYKGTSAVGTTKRNPIAVDGTDGASSSSRKSSSSSLACSSLVLQPEVWAVLEKPMQTLRLQLSDFDLLQSKLNGGASSNLPSGRK